MSAEGGIEDPTVLVPADLDVDDRLVGPVTFRLAGWLATTAAGAAGVVLSWPRPPLVGVSMVLLCVGVAGGFARVGSRPLASWIRPLVGYARRAHRSGSGARLPRPRGHRPPDRHQEPAHPPVPAKPQDPPHPQVPPPDQAPVRPQVSPQRQDRDAAVNADWDVPAPAPAAPPRPRRTAVRRPAADETATAGIGTAPVDVVAPVPIVVPAPPLAHPRPRARAGLALALAAGLGGAAALVLPPTVSLPARRSPIPAREPASATPTPSPTPTASTAPYLIVIPFDLNPHDPGDLDPGDPLDPQNPFDFADPGCSGGELGTDPWSMDSDPLGLGGEPCD